MAIHLFQWLAINWMIFVPIFTMEKCLDITKPPSIKKNCFASGSLLWGHPTLHTAGLPPQVCAAMSARSGNPSTAEELQPAEPPLSSHPLPLSLPSRAATWKHVHWGLEGGDPGDDIEGLVSVSTECTACTSREQGSSVSLQARSVWKGLHPCDTELQTPSHCTENPGQVACHQGWWWPGTGSKVLTRRQYLAAPSGIPHPLPNNTGRLHPSSSHRDRFEIDRIDRPPTAWQHACRRCISSYPNSLARTNACASDSWSGSKGGLQVSEESALTRAVHSDVLSRSKEKIEDSPPKWW